VTLTSTSRLVGIALEAKQPPDLPPSNRHLGTTGQPASGYSKAVSLARHWSPPPRSKAEEGQTGVTPMP
jgi:hypothetical protein